MPTTIDMSEPDRLLRSLYHHLVLPPRLPNRGDDQEIQPYLVEDLLQRTIDAVRDVKRHASKQHAQDYEIVVASLSISKAIRHSTSSQREEFNEAFQNIPPSCPLIIHVVEQNAGLLLWRHEHIPCGQSMGNAKRPTNVHEELVVFEAFESAPRSEAVLATDGALKMVFPGSCSAMAFSDFQDVSFRTNLACVIDLACHERLPRFSARIRKAGTSVLEPRDTTNPELITTWLMTLIEANGRTFDVTSITKRVKDEVCWSKGAKAPWRRMPFYLVLRVGLRRSFELLFGQGVGIFHYKLLITKILSNMLCDLAGKVTWDMLNFVRAKICRRMAKLEEACSDSGLPSTLKSLIRDSSHTIREQITTVSNSLDISWYNFKQHSRRAIFPLGSRYAPSSSLVQDLPHSRSHLLHAIRMFQRDSTVIKPQPQAFDDAQVKSTRYDAYTNLFLRLAEEERSLQVLAAQQIPESKSACHSRCCDLADKILEYVESVRKYYQGMAQRLSNALLVLMDLWTALDKCALAIIPLLHEFPPIFPINIVDALYVVSWKDMCILQRISTHLKSRHSNAISKITILHDPVKDCFTERFFDSSAEMQAKFIEIEAEAAKSRAAKEQELMKMMEERRDMETEYSTKSCVSVSDGDSSHREYHNRKRCPKCQLQDKIKRQKIIIHEHPFPQDISQAKAIVFELSMPESFALYRDASWNIIKHFGQRQDLPPIVQPGTILKDYPPLAAHWMTKACFAVRLASLKKSFLLSHWRELFLPANVDDVCLPCAIEPTYFDSEDAFPLRNASSPPTYSRHLGLKIAQESPFSFVMNEDEFTLVSSGPSSNKIVASQSKCPAGLGYHEYLSFQSLYSGFARRWSVILIELGSSNINFSNEACAALIKVLATQAGPLDTDDSLCRIAHRELCEAAFCEQLLEQISSKLKLIEVNWRETHCMSMLIILLLRILVMCPASVVSKALKILEKARHDLVKWMKALLAEMQSTNLDATQLCSRYTLWAALLCRQTFRVYNTSDFLSTSKLIDPISLDGDALRIYILATISLQQSVKELSKNISLELKEAMIQDILLASSLQSTLSNAFELYSTALIDTLHDLEIIPRAQNCADIRILLPPYDSWVEVALTSSVVYGRAQNLHFHMLRGHILVDGTPQGKLAEDFRRSPILDELFGQANLYAISSHLRGMKYRLSVLRYGNEIHVGMREGIVFVRVLHEGRVWEILDRRIFQPPESAFGDLPHTLIHDCLPFLDLQRGIVELRRVAGNIWTFFSSDWRLNIRDSRVTRSTKNRNFTLVNYCGMFYDRVLTTFRDFELYSQIIVYQPDRGALEVELRRLELKFFVNHHFLFESQKLGCEIPIDQDSGCLYGLRSALVIQDVKNPIIRHVLIPFGIPRWQKKGMHLEITIENDGNYARYTIDRILRRLSSPVQRRLLHRKALIHALTSFIIPDSLTGRTGTEEAMYTLAADLCQPTAPLERKHLADLEILQKLMPRRVFYPPDLESLQRVSWDPSLTTSVQHDGLLELINRIFDMSNSLCPLFPGSNLVPNPEEYSYRLNKRGVIQRARFERPNIVSEKLLVPVDLDYVCRHNIRRSTQQENVSHLARLIQSWPQRLSMPRGFPILFEQYERLGGFAEAFTGLVSLSSCFEVHEALGLGSMVEYCRSMYHHNRYELMFVVALAAYNHVNMDVATFWLGFAFFEQLKSIKAPVWKSYDYFRWHQHPQVPNVIQIFDSYFRSAKTTSNLAYKESTSPIHGHDENDISIDAEAFARYLVGQFPCEVPRSEPYAYVKDTYTGIEIPTSSLKPAIDEAFLRLFQNLQLSKFLDKVQLFWQDHHELSLTDKQKTVPQQKIVPMVWNVPRLFIVTMATLFETVPSIPQSNSRLTNGQRLKMINTVASGTVLMPDRSVAKAAVQHSVEAHEGPTTKELRKILELLTRSDSKTRQDYISDLIRSLDALCTIEQNNKCRHSTTANPHKMLSLDTVKLDAQACFDNLHQALISSHRCIINWLSHGGLSPCITPLSLLEQLRCHTGFAKGSLFKEALVNYGVTVTRYQQALRITDAQLKNKVRKVSEETRNRGHGNWNPMQYPDWLLIELDGNILIRDEQVVVALATINPSSGQNSLLQMNMGQGKTSVIIPMVAVELADTKHLARILVPRQLLPSTMTLLQARLGGLVGRGILHLPYSRRTDPNKMVTQVYLKLQKHAKTTAAVFLAAPEHIMSFKLCGLQHISDARLEEAVAMIKVQTWLDGNARDVVDESDFVFSPRTALCFPSGNQSIVDGHPHRWRTIENMLELVASNIVILQHERSKSIEIVDRQNGGFPFIFFLQQTIEEELLTRVVAQVLGGKSILPMQNFSRDECAYIGEFISLVKPSEPAIDFVQTVLPDQPKVKKTIYLLRGLIVHRILLLALKKRWNVQYGIDPRRDPIAVPFRAKGVPSEQSEWGHPDVAILFTILSYYYSGLSIEQVRQSLALVAQCDDPARAYQDFIHACTRLNGTYRDWEAINTDDGGQLAAIWNDIRYNTGVIDYYLNHCVFPRHAKQFRVKLQASGWDIPLFSPSISRTSHSLTTGFSGTNDNRTILPLTIQQHDLPSLAHTSAEVLTYLLHPRNRRYFVLADRNGRRMTETDLLHYLWKLEIRVLLDAGAQILEMSNEQVAKTWLDIDKNAPAAVYFNDQDVAWVRYRQGTIMPLLVSPFADDLSGVLVYIDEAHCRGIDLMLPDNARGALTLGLSLQKDTLIQSAMRLRQLGTTQGVAFFAPLEVNQSIMDVVRVPSNHIDSAHIIYWLLHSTSEQLESLSPLFYSHGLDFCRRIQGAIANADFMYDEDQRNRYLEVLQQKERKSLVRLYEPKTKAQIADVRAISYTAPRLKAFVKELTARRRTFQDTGNAVHASTLQEVEQEREVEVEVEVEKVRELQRPNWYHPYSFERLDQYIIKFVATGELPPRQNAGFEHMFDYLKRTATGKRHGVTVPKDHSSLFLTKEFALTVHCPHNRPDDSFLRPVQWLLWSRRSEQALLLSPEETELVIPIIRKEEASQVHLLTYAAPVTRKMLHFNHLNYYAIPTMPADYQIPTWLRIELGFFAGRLYFDWHESLDVLNFLGLGSKVATETATEAAAANGDHDTHQSPGHQRTFTTKPLAFLQDWISARRKMQDWSTSPMGFIVAGRKLHHQHPFFSGINGSDDAGNKKVAFAADAEEKLEEVEFDIDDDDVFCNYTDHVEGSPQQDDWDDRKSASEE